MRLNPAAAPNLRLLIFLLFTAIQVNCCAQSLPLLNGFAHNDYRHKHPLFDALDNGYTNIEADIFLRDTTLVVAHFCPLFREGKTLEKLYLKPLHDRVLQNNGRVYSNYARPVILMIDVKSGSDKTYRELERMLDKYRDMLTSYINGKITYGAITVVISGHKPYNMLEGETSRLAFIDDDLRRVGRDTITHNVFTMASCKYSRLISWDGKGIIPVLQQQRLRAFVVLAHGMGAKVRLWASPERKAVWDELLKCGVDLINTDKLVTLKNYLNTNTVTLAKLN